MARTGTMRKSSLKQQRESAQLELIIEEFGRHMRNASRTYIAEPRVFSGSPSFTPNMTATWGKYIQFCMEHPE